MEKEDVMNIIQNKKYQWVLTIAILFIVLLMSSSIRLSNWNLLTDSTTGEKIPIALDPYYFLRVSETIVENNGVLPEFDEKRIPGFNIKWHPEIMPRIVVWMWESSNIFGKYTLREVDVFSPVFFYGIGLIIFFFLVYVLTRSKFAGILASTFLAFAPSYLYRTMAGFSDHEAIGMISFFTTILLLSISFKYLDKLPKKDYLKSGIFGASVGAATALTIATWGGVSVFLFMIIPISFLLFWVIKLKDINSIIKDSGIIYYACWIVFTIIFAKILGFSVANVIGRMLSSNGIIVFVVLGFIIVDRLFIYLDDKINFRGYNKKYRMAYAGGVLAIIGILVLPLVGENFFTLLWKIFNRLLNPLWDTARLTTTVAENAQPYLVNWMSSIGKPMFFLFLLGIVLISVEFSEKIKLGKNKVLIISGIVAMIFGILFSRISPNSILNGSGIFSISGLVYLGGLSFFIYAFLKVYSNESIKVSPLVIILFSWMFVVLVTGRSTTRLFFAIAPFMAISAAYALIILFKYYNKKGLDEIVRILVVVALVITIIASIMIISSSYTQVSNQAKYTGPSANAQWQSAMSWVKENTSKDAVFVHWWDYGYWVQTLGQRATVADGGHPQGVYDGNHKIGRYILTTPYPETALSFFKTMNIDYLLIDQTDLGKYPAYSKIGGGNGDNKLDRYSAIPVMPMNPKQTRETANGTMIAFSGGTYLFEDIIYNYKNRSIFLPAGKAALAGVVINTEKGKIKQPEAVYVYNNVQTRIPIRYIYIDGKITDFKSGLDVIIDVIPGFSNGKISKIGAVIYLSQKVSKSLFAQLFLLDDVFGEYKTIKLVHTEANPVVASLKNQGVPLGDFIFYQGFRGPIKIWDVQKIPNDIKFVKEFKEPSNGTFGALDGLEFKSNTSLT